MQIAILGPLSVRDDDGEPVTVAGARLRTLLARLALDAGRAVGTGVLVETVWGERPPADEANALQTLVSRLRRALGATAIAQAPGGYRLDVAGTDVAAFTALTAHARQAPPGAALELLGDALALWRGPALADVRDAAGSLQVAAAGLDERRTTALLDRAELRLSLDPAGVDVADVAELERLAAEHPLDERVAAVLVRSLAAAGRQPDALRAYDSLRVRLADELGVDPSPELRDLHLQLLRAAEPGERATRRTNLKAQLTSFVGREDEVARIAKSLETSRLVTLVGPGGAGKTRLAAEAGHLILDSAPDGVWLSELAAVTAAGDVAQVVFASLGLREIHLFNDARTALTARDTVAKLRDVLADRSTVLVLDNCEHVVEAAARLAEHLLLECPGLRVLATSREPLGIFGETLLAVPPLGQPGRDADAVEAIGYPAVRLFADRAAAVVPGFAVDAANVGGVVEIVRRLDGLPLAIELAAARLRSLPVADIARRLGDRFRLLTGGSRTALPRHRTLRAVVEWSWELLDEDERRFAEVLAVFPAGVTARSAAAVHPDAPPEYVAEDVLASLADKSLLQPVEGGRRMRMLETIREYGADRLVERGELAAVRERHARYFRELLERAEPHLTTRDQLPWFELLTTEQENILAALRYYCDVEDPDTALSMALAMGGYAMMLGAHADVARWTADAIAVPGGRDPRLRLMARAMFALNATAVGGPGESNVARSTLQEVVAELRGTEVSFANPMLALMLPAMAFFAGEEELARRWSDVAVASDHPWTRAAALMFRASFAENSGSLDESREDLDAALAAFEAIGERWGLASTLRNIAQIRTLDGDLDGAAEAYDRALALTRELKSTDDEDFTYTRLAELALRRGDSDAARRYLRAALDSGGEDRSPWEGLFRLAVVGDLEFRLGDTDPGRAKVREAIERLATMPREIPMMGHMRALAYASSARIAAHDEDHVRAREHAAEAVTAALGTNDMPIVALAAMAVADMGAADDPARSARLVGAAAVLRGAEDPTSLDVAPLVARLRDVLGADAFSAAYDEGRALPREAALALVGDVGV